MTVTPDAPQDDFRDPAGPASPTLFEWSGGLRALTRVTRLAHR